MAPLIDTLLFVLIEPLLRLLASAIAKLTLKAL